MNMNPINFDSAHMEPHIASNIHVIWVSARRTRRPLYQERNYNTSLIQPLICKYANYFRDFQETSITVSWEVIMTW